MRIKLKPEPKVGDIRIVSKFLWFPKCINRECRWLEKVSYKQKYKRCGVLNPTHYWDNIEWVDKRSIVIDGKEIEISEESYHNLKGILNNCEK